MKTMTFALVLGLLSFAAGSANAAWCGLDTARPYDCDRGYIEYDSGHEGSHRGGGGSGGGGGGGESEGGKSNAGRGNGPEGDPDRDPGNSGGHNNGGD